MDGNSKAVSTRRRMFRKFQCSCSRSRVSFVFVTFLALCFLLGTYLQIRDDSESEKPHLNYAGPKYAQRTFLEPLTKTIVQETGLVQVEKEVQGILKEHGHVLANDEPRSLSNIAKEQPEQELTLKRLLAAEKCPACFGESLCEQANSGLITVDVANRKLEHKGVYFGRFRDIDIVAKRLARTPNWKQLDEFICQNASMPGHCDVSKMISKTILVTDDALKLSWLRDAWRIAHKDEQIAFESCMTVKHIEELKKVYDQNADGQLSKTEQAYMMTSLLLNPEAAVLNYFASRRDREIWPFPKYLGACGRVIFVENGGKLLDVSLESPWKQRANLAVQLLDMIDTFRNGDPDWIVMFLDFRYENFAVDQYGRLKLIDFDGVVLIDREESDGEENKERYNMEGFKGFLSEIEKDGRCMQVTRYSQMMYALACVRLLSYLPEHRLKSGEHHRSKNYVRPPGLLWGPPEHESKAIEALLRGCVEEKVVGGRLNTVQELKALLRQNVK